MKKLAVCKMKEAPVRHQNKAGEPAIPALGKSRRKSSQKHTWLLRILGLLHLGTALWADRISERDVLTHSLCCLSHPKKPEFYFQGGSKWEGPFLPAHNEVACDNALWSLQSCLMPLTWTVRIQVCKKKSYCKKFRWWTFEADCTALCCNWAILKQSAHTSYLKASQILHEMVLMTFQW